MARRFTRSFQVYVIRLGEFGPKSRSFDSAEVRFSRMTGSPLIRSLAVILGALEHLGYMNPHTGTLKAGNHAFRRFRNTHLLNRTECPEGLQKFWMSHTDESMGDLCDKIKEDEEFRRERADKCGFGFKLRSGGPNVPKKEGDPLAAKAAYVSDSNLDRLVGPNGMGAKILGIGSAS
jgi:hypothetical protein